MGNAVLLVTSFAVSIALTAIELLPETKNADIIEGSHTATS